MWVRSSTGGTRPADRPASAGRWGREASTDHSHEDGERAVDAVLFTVQDPRTTRHRRVPTAHGPAIAPENCETRVPLWVPETPQMSGDLLVFVYQSAEPVVPSEAPAT